jgi:hypothetical protein
MNLAFPHWDFIFTLIYNYTQGQWVLEGLAMVLFTTAMLAAVLAVAEYVYRRSV